MVVVAVTPHGDADHLCLFDHGLDLLGAIVLVATGIPTPDAATGSPDLDGIGSRAGDDGRPCADPKDHRPGRPRMGFLVELLGAVVGVTVAGNAAEAKTSGQNARALEDALVDAVANLDTKAADLADGGEAVGEAVVGLLDGDGLLRGAAA